MVPNTVMYSGLNMPEEQAEEAVANYQGPYSES
jgi:hypothetical protein